VNLKQTFLVAICVTSLGVAKDAGSFLDSSEFKEAKKSPIAEKLGIYSKFLPGPKTEGVMSSMTVGSGLDWVLTPHRIVNPSGEVVTVFVVGPDGLSMSSDLVQQSPDILAFCRAVTSSNIFLKTKFVYSDGLGFPSRKLGQMEIMAMNMSTRQAAASGQGAEQSGNFVGTVEHRSVLTPYEALEEKILLDEETKTLGQGEAENRAKARVARVKAVERARLKKELRYPMTAEETGLLPEASVRDERIKQLAAKITNPPETRTGWTLVLYIHESSAKGVSVFSKTVFTSEALLLKDGAVMTAGRQRSMAVGPTSGGLSNMAMRNGYTLMGIFN